MEENNEQKDNCIINDIKCALSISAVSADDGAATTVANYTDLQTTIDDASTGGSIDLSSDYNRNVTLKDTWVNITKNITINGNNHVIDGKEGYVFDISKNVVVTINNVTFINSIRPIDNSGNVILNNCTFIKNNGAVNCYAGSTLEVNDCNFINNTRTSKTAMGGAISATNAVVKINGSKFINNSAVNSADDNGFAFGGAVFVQGGGNLTVVNTEFTTNKANSKNNNAQGGAIFAWNNVESVSVENCTFTGNSAVNGGAIYTDNNTELTVKGSNFTGNSAIDDTVVGSGGAIFSEGNLNVDNSTFVGNNATNGGAIYAAATSNKTVTVKDSEFSKNTATHTDDAKGGEGGAILLIGSIDASVSGCTFEDNKAKFNGADINNQATNLAVTDSSFANGVASKGGAIFTNTTVIVDNSTFTNSARPVYNMGTATLNNSTFTNNKGAISSLSGSTLEVNDCNFINNTRASSYAMGGAIYATNAAVKVNGSKFINNSAVNSADDNGFAFGGAVFVQGGGNLTVVNTEFTTNKANSKNNNAQGGAIFAWNNVESVSVENCTFTGNSAVNGGAIYTDNNTELTVKGSNFTGNSAIDDTVVGSGGAIFSEGNLNVDNSTFVGNNATNGGAIYAAATSNKTVTVKDSEFSKNTATHTDDAKGGEGGAILLIGSIDASVSGCTFEDNKAKFNGADINNQATNLAVTDSSFANGVASKGGAIFTNTTVIVDNSTFTNSARPVYNMGTATLNNSTFTNNKGAISSLSGSTLEVNDCNFINNTRASSYAMGGAIYATNAAVKVNGSKFINNSAVNSADDNGFAFGGAVFVQGGGNLTVVNTEFTTNKANSKNNNAQGGAIFAWNNVESVSVENCTFTGNSAVNGGAIYTDNNTELTVKGSNFTGNSAIDDTVVGSGGAIFSEGNLNVDNSTFVGNNATNGGAIYAAATSNKTVTVKDSEFSKNTATHTDDAKGGEGGAILLIGSIDASVSGCTFEDNTAKYYGGAINNQATNLAVDGTAFENNAAGVSGGAIYNNETLNVDDSTFKDNSATNYGGAIYTGKYTKVSNSEFIGNQADNGSVIYSYPDPAVLVLDNVVADDKGIYDNGTYNVENVTYITETTIDNDSAIIANNVVISGTVSPTANGDITVTIIDEDGTVVATQDGTVTDGEYSVDFGSIKPGNYTVKAEFKENDEYLASEASADIEVLPSMIASDIEMIYKDGTKYNVTVLDKDGNPAAGENVTVSLDGKYFKNLTYTITTDENGVAYLPINLIAGEYNITATRGNESVTTSINVLPATNSLVNNSDIVMYYKNGTKYSVALVNAKGTPVAGETVSLILNGKYFKDLKYDRITDEEGMVYLPINLAVGQYTITAKYGSEAVTNSITVLAKQYNLIGNDLVKYFKNGTQYTVKLLDEQGNPAAGETVALTITGKNFKTVTYNVVTDENGVATLTINLAPGQYSITAKYGAVSTTNTVTVLPVLSTESIIILVGEPADFVANVVDEQGSPAANQKVAFTIKFPSKTVTYYKVTDENGVAKLPINLAKGTYTVNVSLENGAKATGTVKVIKQ
ncbi:MAG: Ig-like domain-containing protein [Methanobrevibacter sp.]|uniref:beta strand repeat-containing protein n=1 Tax=Methanobrevibacter sp. TaxID=66852 RepID=UPI0026E02889|nr:right-handed parallel beta-helix repeat-containing protein [Methanobrevibacter sp.]MDO5847936.1 Ig-like domain-containing protein [Methanobrevibacter sp.]